MPVDGRLCVEVFCDVYLCLNVVSPDLGYVGVWR